MKGAVYCDCGTCLIPLEQARRLNKYRLDVLTIPFFTIKKEHTEGIAMVSQKDKKTYYQATLAARSARKIIFLSMHDRFLNHKSCRESQMAIG